MHHFPAVRPYGCLSSLGLSIRTCEMGMVPVTSPVGCWRVLSSSPSYNGGGGSSERGAWAQATELGGQGAWEGGSPPCRSHAFALRPKASFSAEGRPIFLTQGDSSGPLWGPPTTASLTLPAPMPAAMCFCKNEVKLMCQSQIRD